MGLNNIEKKSRGYELLKIWVKFWHNRVYYRNFSIVNRNKIPLDKPMIFTPNHSNALMDALAVLFSEDILFVFLARADIFKNPKVASILYFLKILPIYRVRDGFDTVKKSKDILRKAVDIITSGDAMVILPEGNHSRIRRLRPLKKGFARMAFQTEELNDFDLDLHVIPMGIDYDHFSKYRSSVVATFGEPVPVKNFIDIYKENPPVALNKLKDALSKNLAPVLIDIRSEDYYDFYNEIRVIYRKHTAQLIGKNSCDESNRVAIDQETIKRLEEYEKTNPEEISKLNDITLRYNEIRKKFGFSNKIVENNGSSVLKFILHKIELLALFPIFIYGALNSLIPYSIPMIIVRKFEDEQFKSSVKFVVSALLFPIMYIIQFLIVFAITDIQIALIYLASLPLSAALAWRWTRVYMQVVAGFRFFINKITGNSKHKEMTELHGKLMRKMEGIIG